jgi:hypothetical protein
VQLSPAHRTSALLLCNLCTIYIINQEGWLPGNVIAKKKKTNKSVSELKYYNSPVESLDRLSIGKVDVVITLFWLLKSHILYP